MSTMKSLGRNERLLALGAGLAAALWAGAGMAHHEVTAKFDESKPLTLDGIVTLVDWRNPHAHVFFNVGGSNGEVVNWAAELDSPVQLEGSGWDRDTLQPGDSISVRGIAARDGSRQVWGESVVQTATGRKVLFAAAAAPVAPKAPRPVPRWPDGMPRLGAVDGNSGYWGHPTSTVLQQQGANVSIGPNGLLRNLADAPKVAPFQPWALGLYRHRQQRHLADDPLFLNCKPPGGVRLYQSALGVQLIEDRPHQRVFMMIGSGNNNYRIIYLDGREQQGQVRGDDDNPLYYGRSVGKWEGDTLVVDTTGFNEDFWFTNGGLPHTDQLTLTERFTRPDFDTLRYDVTIDDPGAYTQPWSASWELKWVGGEELPSYFCQDNRS
jgi:hypothetical protein